MCRLGYGSFLGLDEARAGQFFKLGKDGTDFFMALDELDFDGQLVGDFDQISGVKMVICAETGNALGDRGSGHTAIEKEVENTGVERNALMSGSIAEIDGDFDGFSRLQHSAPLRASEDCSAYETVSASIAPSHTAAKPARRLPTA